MCFSLKINCNMGIVDLKSQLLFMFICLFHGTEVVCKCVNSKSRHFPIAYRFVNQTVGPFLASTHSIPRWLGSLHLSLFNRCHLKPPIHTLLNPFPPSSTLKLHLATSQALLPPTQIPNGTSGSSSSKAPKAPSFFYLLLP